MLVPEQIPVVTCCCPSLTVILSKLIISEKRKRGKWNSLNLFHWLPSTTEVFEKKGTERTFFLNMCILLKGRPVQMSTYHFLCIVLHRLEREGRVSNQEQLRRREQR